MFYILNTVLFSVAKHFYLYKANEKLYLTWLFGYVFVSFLYVHTEFFSLLLEDLGNVGFITYFSGSEFSQSVPQGVQFQILFLSPKAIGISKEGARKFVAATFNWMNLGGKIDSRQSPPMCFVRTY